MSLALLNPIPQIDFAKYDKHLIEAHKRIALLKGACYNLPNPHLLLNPTVMREALASSEIENIITTLSNVLQAELLLEAEQQPADKEVMRYNKALYIGLELLKNIPLGNRIIVAVHDTLMPNEPGYRNDQNRLVNSDTNEVIYLPPTANDIPDLISDLELFLHNETDEVDPLIKTFIAHYQFEAIHPFGDGNGRTGRILMVLCLKSYDLLDLPVLFISGYINTHKAEYYSALRGVTEKKDWDTYIAYMLAAFSEQAEKSTNTLLKIKELHDTTRRTIRNELPKIYSRDLVDAIFNKPFFTPSAYAAKMSVTYQTASKHLKSLERLGIMSSHKIGRYNFFVNKALFELLSGDGAVG